MLQKGDKIPTNLKLINQDGNEVTLGDYLGKTLVLYFYPKAMTPGCTVESCEFRDFNQEMESMDIKVIGISADSSKLLKKFKEKEKLNFELLGDESHKLLEKFGLWAEKSMFGKKYMGILRTTYLVNNDGEIINVWENVKPEGHAKEVFEYIKTNYE